MTQPPEVPAGLTQAEFAAQQGWGKPYVTKLKHEGRLVFLPGGKLLDPVASLARIAETTRALERASESVVSPAFSDARDRKEHYGAELSRLDYLERVGELLRADEVQGTVVDAVTALRTSLEALPALLAPQLAPIADESAVRTLLADHIEVLLTELSAALRKLAQPQPQPQPAAPAPAGTAAQVP